MNIFEAYGLTESTGPVTCTRKINNSSGHVGEIIEGCLMRLKDHPELDYTSRDNVKDEVAYDTFFGEDKKVRVIKGEIMVRGGNVFKKYLCNEEANAEAFEPGNDGLDDKLGMWFKTGDVACV